MASDSLPTAPHSVAEFVKGYEEEHRLRGFRCRHCGLITVTWGLACSRCGAAELEDAPLSERGRVVSFTILHVPGDQFLNDAPYGYVVVELDGGGRVTGWMPEVRSDSDLEVGTRVRFRPGYRPGVQFARDAPAPEGGEGRSGG